MLFNSYVFIFCFLPIVLAGYLLLRRAAQPLWPIVWLVLAMGHSGWAVRRSSRYPARTIGRKQKMNT